MTINEYKKIQNNIKPSEITYKIRTLEKIKKNVKIIMTFFNTGDYKHIDSILTEKYLPIEKSVIKKVNTHKIPKWSNIWLKYFVGISSDHAKFNLEIDESKLTSATTFQKELMTIKTKEKDHFMTKLLNETNFYDLVVYNSYF